MTFGPSKLESAGSSRTRIEILDPIELETRDRGLLIRPSEAHERRELERLRSLNALLMRELASLKEREAQALRLADRDALTGLYNRRKLLQLLDQTMVEAKEQDRRVGLLFIDLNGFKAINDEYGHAVGDLILTMVASRINARVRIGDIVGRYGGDEFVVVLPAVPDLAAVTHVADTIRERVALPYAIDGVDQHLTAAIGESLSEHDGASAESLLHQADLAMYRLKSGASRRMFSLAPEAAELPARRHDD
jgi:diguanylate cyclase (GGDEF)-like protein